jgi:hypothetical protein
VGREDGNMNRETLKEVLIDAGCIVVMVVVAFVVGLILG